MYENVIGMVDVFFFYRINCGGTSMHNSIEIKLENCINWLIVYYLRSIVKLNVPVGVILFRERMKRYGKSTSTIFGFELHLCNRRERRRVKKKNKQTENTEPKTGDERRAKKRFACNLIYSI